MAVIVGTITNVGRRRQAESSIGNIVGYDLMTFKYFKVGEGGWISDGVSRIPKNPSPALTDIEATGAPGDSYFQKNLTADRCEFVLPSTAKLDCFIDQTEGNDNGLGESPRYFEIGIFDEQDNLIIYATFPEETKNSQKILHHIILAVW